MVKAPENAEMLSVPEVHALLKKERELRGELSYEQKLSAEHADLLDRLKDGEKAQALREELTEKLERLNEDQIIKIVDLCPQHEDEIELIFAKDRQGISEEESDTIISIVAEYLD